MSAAKFKVGQRVTPFGLGFPFDVTRCEKHADGSITYDLFQSADVRPTEPIHTMHGVPESEITRSKPKIV